MRLTTARAWIMGAVLLAGCRPKDPVAALPATGAPLPQFDLPLLGGGRIAPDSLRGAPTVVVLWSTQCGFSRAALRGMEALADEYAARGARFLIVAADDEGHLRAFVDSVGVHIPLAYTGGQHSLNRTFDRSARLLPFFSDLGLPSFLVLDADGTVVMRKAGVTPHDLDAEGIRLLKSRG